MTDRDDALAAFSLRSNAFSEVVNVLADGTYIGNPTVSNRTPRHAPIRQVFPTPYTDSSEDCRSGHTHAQIVLSRFQK